MVAVLLFALLTGQNYVSAVFIPPLVGSGYLDIHNRIVGGVDAPAGIAPYQVSLRASFLQSHFCGGSILNERWVLTAGHCADGTSPSSITIVVGTNSLKKGGTRYKVDKVIVHDSYNSLLITNDVALLRSNKDIQFNEMVQPIPLPERDTPGGADLMLTGWGRLQYPGSLPDMLQIIHLKALDVEECQNQLATVNPVFQSQICSLTEKGEGACHGDSGGPLIEDGHVVGVVSWGMPCALGYPDVYSRVYHFHDWIFSRIQIAIDTDGEY